MFAHRKRRSSAVFGLLMVVSVIAAACAQATPTVAPTNLPVSSPLPPPATYTPGAGPAATATIAPTTEPAASGNVNAFGVTLPDDAQRGTGRRATT